MRFRAMRKAAWAELAVVALGALALGWGFSPPAKARPVSASPPIARTFSYEPSTAHPTPVAHPALQHNHPAPVPRANIPHGTICRLRWGQTLWGLSQQYHLPLGLLERVNHIAPGEMVLANTLLAIPRRYTVHPGDTIANIARRLKIFPASLSRLNRLHGPIHPGESLLIPYTGRVPANTVAAPNRPAPKLAPLTSRGTWPNPYHLTAQDIYNLARLVQAEAGDQPFLAQVAVAAVVLNRVKSPAFPDTVDGVILAPGQFETVTAGTFWNNPSATAILAAKAAATGWDPTGGALYFYNPAMPHAAWMDGLPDGRAIGSQVFAR
jgi:N-acetylmuramoyl-L-alanine amidase